MNKGIEFVRHLGAEMGAALPALEILLRVTLLVILAAIVVIILRRSSAASRHLVWALSLGGTLLVPLVYVAFPAWRLAVLPAVARPTNIVAKSETMKAPSSPAIEPEKIANAFPQNISEVPVSRSVVIEKITKDSSTTASATAESGKKVDPTSSPPARFWLIVLAVLWGLGTLAGIVWTVIGTVGAWLVARRAKPAAEAGWQSLLRQLRGSCRGSQTVQIRESPRVPVPMTWGFLRPVILIPEGSCAWSDETKRSVLLHELGHIRRRDCLVHLLGRLAYAAYWFHPLVWLAAKQLRKSSEQAADDAVLASNIAPPDYAEHLLSVARQMRGFRWIGHVALPMASPSDLKVRISAILDSNRNHQSLRRKTCFAFIFAAILLLVPCSLLRPSSVRAADEAKPASPAKMAVAEKSPDAPKKPSEAVKEDPLEPIQKINLETLDAETGKPLADAPITIRVFHPQPRKFDNDAKKSDAEGKAICEIRGDLSKIGEITIEVRPAGYVPQHYHWEPAQSPLSIPSQLTMRFKQGVSIGGQIQDSAGKPIKNAQVEVLMPATNGHGGYYFHLGTLKSDQEGRWQCDVAPEDLSPVNISVEHPDFLRASAEANLAMKEQKHVLRLEQGVFIRGQVLNAKGEPVKGVDVSLGRIWAQSNDPQAKTDDKGEFVLKNCPLTESAITVQGEGYAPQCQKITVQKENPPAAFRLEPGTTLRGLVVDPQGKPLEGIFVYPDTWQDLRTLKFRTTTDKEGRFVWKDAPRDAVLFYLSGKGYKTERNLPLTAAAEEQTIKLSPELVIRGTVVDEETGKPIAKFQYCTGFRRDTENEVFFNNQFTSGENGQFEYHMDSGAMPNNFLKVVADGYNPAISRAFKPTEGNQSFEFKLKKGKGLGGVVLLPDGKPALEATVALISKGSKPFIQNGELSPHSSAVRAVTNAEGRFSFVPQSEPCSFFALHPAGYGEISQSELEKAGSIKLQPWGRLEGVAKIGDKIANAEGIFYQPNQMDFGRGFSLNYQATSDDDGHFVFDRVFPGKGSVSLMVEVENGMMRSRGATSPAAVEIFSGKTAKVEIGGKGRPVVGHIDSGGKIAKWTDLGSLSTKYRISGEFNDHYSFKVEPDGSFHINDVSACSYTLDLRIHEPMPNTYRNNAAPLGSEPQIGLVHFDFTVPEMPDGRDDEPLDLGTIKATLYKRLQPGDTAPEFSVDTIDGQKFSLKEQQGKVLLITFWPDWQGRSGNPQLEFKRINERFHDNPKFAMIGLAQGANKETLANRAKKDAVTWPQAALGGGFDSGTSADYGVRGEVMIFLVGGDGKIIAKNLHGEELEAAIENALKP